LYALLLKASNIREKEVHAKTVEIVIYANIREEEVNK
jgi:hypothetical protein